MWANYLTSVARDHHRQVGKWHGGMSSPQQLPINRGFNSSFGYLSGAEDHYLQTRDGFHDFWRSDSPAYNETGV